MGVFAPWRSDGDPVAWYPEEAWNQADPGGAWTIASRLFRPARSRSVTGEALSKPIGADLDRDIAPQGLLVGDPCLSNESTRRAHSPES